MNVTVIIKTNDEEFDQGEGLAAMFRKLANQVEDWKGANEFSLGILNDKRQNVGRFTVQFDGCPACLDRPGYDGIGRLCSKCGGIGRVRPSGQRV